MSREGWAARQRAASGKASAGPCLGAVPGGWSRDLGGHSAEEVRVWSGRRGRAHGLALLEKPMATGFAQSLRVH